jgi:hypothetical protein
MYAVAVRSALLYGAETWPLRKEDIEKLERTQMRMLRWMAGISRSEGRTNDSIRSAFGIESIAVVIRRSRLRWFGHVERREPQNLTRMCQMITVDGKRPVGRPRKTWTALIEDDLRRLNLTCAEVHDRARWRSKIAMSGPTPDDPGKDGP